MSSHVIAADTGSPSICWSPALFVDLAWLLLLALLLRLATYNGAFGSDDVTYLSRAIDVATGTWSHAAYNGALRYGFNIPAGAFVWAFGPVPWAANLWPLLCSLIEIALVYLMATSAMCRRAGLFAALLLASTPLHVAVATRIHADSVVSMFITLAFVLLWFGWRSRSHWLLFVCGLAIGCIFWTKELVAVTWLAFLPFLWLFRGRWQSTLPVIAGTSLMLILHGWLMFAIAGHPLHAVLTVLGAVDSSLSEPAKGQEGAIYYLSYLFFDLRHTGLVGLLAVCALWLAPRWLRLHGLALTGFGFVLVWLAGLLLVLSLFPTSFSPLRLVMKQSNYITLFLGPLVILAGMALAAIDQRKAHFTLVVAVLCGVALSLLQQADYRMFTSNSKGLSEWAVRHPDALLVGSTNNSSMGNLWVRLNYPGKSASIMSFRDVTEKSVELADVRDRANALYAVIDRQTMRWFAGPSPIAEPLPCWTHAEPITPQDLAAGNHFAAGLSAIASRAARLGVPGAASGAAAFGQLALPAPADVYRVSGPDVFCQAG